MDLNVLETRPQNRFFVVFVGINTKMTLGILQYLLTVIIGKKKCVLCA